MKKERRGGGIKKVLLKTGKKSKNTDSATSYVSDSQEVEVELADIGQSSDNISFMANKEISIENITSDIVVRVKDDLGNQFSKLGAKLKTDASPVRRTSYAQKVLEGLHNIELKSKQNHPSDIVPITSSNAIKVTNTLKSEYLKQSTKPKTDANPVPRTTYAQKVLEGLSNIELKSKQNHSSDIVPITSSNAIKVTNTLKSEYLKQSVKPKTDTNSIPRTNYARKVSARLHNMELGSSKEENSIFVEGDEASIYDPLIQYESVSSGLHFQNSYCKYEMPDNDKYRMLAVNFCHKLEKFRQLHLIYCIQLINLVFKIENDQLVISDTVKNLFVKLTSHAEILFFILKVFFLINISALFGGKKVINNIRYCSTYFYNQSLLDLLILKVIMGISKGDSFVFHIKEMFELHYEHLNSISSHEPYSGEFFQKVFDICRDLASVKLSGKEDQKLIDFAMLACMVYCGHMVSMLYRMLYSLSASGGKENPLLCRLNAQRFCLKCHNLRTAIVHMYHPADEKEFPKNVGNVIDVPLNIWRRCSKEIDYVVRESVSQDKMSFSIFVNDMISPAKDLILLPNTRHFYASDIKMYNEKIKMVTSLLPLPQTRVMSSSVVHDSLCNR
ncbi:DUF3514 domain-containing protein [Ehrlichia sp. JZT12]